MRFKLDENLPASLRELLLQNGYHAETVIDEGLGGSTDRALALIKESSSFGSRDKALGKS
jgi:predicted nuclease of predicted toxin-antitoxin system